LLNISEAITVPIGRLIFDCIVRRLIKSCVRRQAHDEPASIRRKHTAIAIPGEAHGSFGGAAQRYGGSVANALTGARKACLNASMALIDFTF
jgi:hypothetical protein